MLTESLLFLLLSATSAPAPPIYDSPRITNPITIDGKLDDPAWSHALWTHDFRDLRGSDHPAPTFRTRAKVLHDDEFLYIAAEMIDPDIRATVRDPDASLHTETAFEIFIDPDGDGQRYVEIQINPHNALLDLLMTRPYRQRGKADIGFTIENLRHAVDIRGTINDATDRDEGWTAELAIPIDQIVKLAAADASPAPGVRWRMNLARVWREGNAKEPNYSAWSVPGEINLHLPARWGWLRFSDSR